MEINYTTHSKGVPGWVLPKVEMMQCAILWSDPAHFSRGPCIKLIKFGQDLIKLDGND